MLRTPGFLLGLALVSLPAFAYSSGMAPHEASTLKSIAAAAAGMQHRVGLIALDWDAKTGHIFLEIPMTGNAEHTRSPQYIYTHSTPWSVGTSSLGGFGLDRGQISPGAIVHFERTGPKLLLVEPNLAFRS